MVNEAYSDSLGSEIFPRQFVELDTILLVCKTWS